MTLDELARLGLPQPPPRVPTWTLGFWRRRSITFANGTTDSATRVFWLQSGGLTADLRLPVRRRDVESRAEQARLEGGLAQTSWDGSKMSWDEWTAFQLHDKWPEPALLTRIGDCLIEFAPSGIYVEDWRLQSSRPGLLAGLALIEERDCASGAVLHRGGGLIVTGEHAAWIKGRPEPLEGETHLERYLARHGNDPKAVERAFAFEASYARRRGDGEYLVEASLHPNREGKTLLSLDGFAVDTETGSIRQRTRDHGRDVERLFTLDTLLADYSFDLATAASGDALAWLAREHETLQRDAHPIDPIAS